MKIIIGNNAGICYIAEKAINRILEESKKNSVYCVGEVVHNKKVVDHLKKAGICFIDKAQKLNGTIIIGPHGTTKDFYEYTEKNNIEYIDLTCPIILKIKNIAEDYVKKGYFIIVTGKQYHAEILGIKSIAKGKCKSIENKSEIAKIKKIINNEKKILLISQTTFNSKEFDEIGKVLKETIKEDTILEINKTICSTTEARQKETKEVAQNVDAMIIVGDKNSSNTNELYKIACEYCDNTQFVLNEKELDFSLVRKNYKIGIMAGASTPNEDILAIKNALLESTEINN